MNRMHLVPYSSPGTTLVSADFSNNAVIHTRSEDETRGYLAKAADIYHDPNPQIIRRAAIDSPRRYEQRIIIRYLQPPDLPPPGVIALLDISSVAFLSLSRPLPHFSRSSLKRDDHHNYQHLHRWWSANEHPLHLHHLRSFFANDHPHRHPLFQLKRVKEHHLDRPNAICTGVCF